MLGGKIYTVSELTYQIKEILSTEFDALWVEGEIRDFKVSPSGHAHFVLTDGESSLRCVIFGYRSKATARLRLRDGLAVRSFGRIDVYPRGGTYQQIVELVVPWGAGIIESRLEALKRKLAGEGIFDESRKRPIPQYVKVIGLVTSPSGAAIRDFLKTLRKIGGFRVLFIPVTVQGEDAPQKISRAIRKLGRAKGVDVIVVTRGGGSREDLSAFNDESVVRAISESPVPVISAVGHSIDTTLADLAADLHLYTPTAAAEFLVSRRLALKDTLRLLTLRLTHSIRNVVLWKARRLTTLARMMEALSPENQIKIARETVGNLRKRLNHAISRQLEIKKMKLLEMEKQLRTLDPLSVLERGYAVVFTEGGKVADSVSKLSEGDTITILLKDGRAKAEVKGIEQAEENPQKGKL